MQRLHRHKKGLSRLTAISMLAAGSLVVPPAFAVTFSTPDGVSGAPPTETNGGASRNGGQCSAQASRSTGSITPILPKTTDRLLTVSDRPTFFVYVPPSTAMEASFSLKDKEDELHYRTKVSLPPSGGVIGIPLPETASKLQVEQTYKWLLEIHCYPEFDPDNPLIEGSVQRTTMEPTLESQLAEKNTAVAQAELYGAAGIWYDTVSTLAQARQSQPNDPTLAKNWEDLLVSVGLEEIAAQPLLP